MPAGDKTEIIDRFDHLAKVYGLVTPFMWRTWNRMATIARLQPGDRVLDVAGGTGSLAVRLTRHDAAVTLVDLSPAMLERAARRLRGTGADLRQADATDLPFPDNSFDVSFISLALHEVPLSDAEAFLKEMARVTRRAIVAADFAVPRTRIGTWALKQTIGRVEEPSFFVFLEVGLDGLVRRAGLETAESMRPLFAGTEIALVHLAERGRTAAAAAAEQ